MKKIISILFIVFSVFSFSDVVSGKRIQVRGTSTKELLPNSAKITLEIVTENDNLDKASKENSEMLEKYKNLLRKTNTKYEKINSSDYTTSENYWWDSEVKNKGEKEFRTTLTVEADSIDLNSLKDFMAALAGDKIYSLQRNVAGNHVFKIIEQDKTNKGAYQKALNTFNDLQKKLSSKGISANKIKIAGYNNEEVSMEKRTSVKKVKQKVSHTIEVTTRDMKSIGNIVNLAHSLKIGSTGYIEYDIDNKQKLEDELYENAYREAAKKAQAELLAKKREVDALVQQGKKAAAGGNFAEAQRAFNKAAAQMPSGDTAFAAEQYREMADAMQALSKNSPANKTQALNEASGYIKKSIAAKNDDAKAHYVYAQIADAQNNAALAVQELEAARRFDPQNAQYNYELGRKYFAQKKYPQ